MLCHTCAALLALASATGAVEKSPTSPKPDPQAVDRETLTYRTVEADGGDFVGTSTIRIKRSGKKLLITEARKQKTGDQQTYRVELDAKTLLPFSWSRVASKEGETNQASMVFAKDRVVATLKGPDGKTQKANYRMTGKRLVVEPLLKFYLAQLVAKGEYNSSFDFLVFMEGRLETVTLEVKDMGVKEIKVAAGTFTCRHLKVGPASSLLAAAVPPGDMYMDTKGSGHFIAGYGAMTRLSPVLKTELTGRGTGSP